MPSWNLGQIISRVTASVGRRTDLSKSDISFWANEAYEFVRERAPHQDSEATTKLSVTSNDPTVSMPGGVNEVISISHTTTDNAPSSRMTLRQISIEEYASEDSFTTSKPEKFAFFGNTLNLVPSPESDISLLMYYKGWPEVLTSESSIPSVSTPWRSAMYYKTKELVMNELLNDPAGAAAARNQFLSTVASLDDDEAKRQKASREAFGVQPYTGEPD